MSCEDHCACLSVAQVRVMGAMMGSWGREKYGMKPIKKDALEYWPERLERLKEEILKETGEAHNQTVPCAFVTFRRAAAPTDPLSHVSPANAPCRLVPGDIKACSLGHCVSRCCAHRERHSRNSHLCCRPPCRP